MFVKHEKCKPLFWVDDEGYKYCPYCGDKKDDTFSEISEESASKINKSYAGQFYIIDNESADWVTGETGFLEFEE
jgi:hypothetical protein